MEEKILIAFNKRGDKMGRTSIPQSFFLETEEDWIRNTLERSPHLDGIAFTLSSSGKMIIKKYAE